MIQSFREFECQTCLCYEMNRVDISAWVLYLYAWLIMVFWYMKDIKIFLLENRLLIVIRQKKFLEQKNFKLVFLHQHAADFLFNRRPRK